MINRRQLMTRTSGLALGSPFLNPIQAAPTDIQKLDLVELGKSGIKTSRLAQGTGTRGGGRHSNQTRPGFQHFVKLMQHAYERGVRLFDLADQYGSHIYFREALRHIPREDITILSKVQYRLDGKKPQDMSPPEQRQFAKNALERFRTELKVDVIDIMLMHNMTTAKWDEELAGYIEVLQEYKQAGKIKAIGMSCHTLPALKRATELDWMNIALTRINPYGKIMDGSPEEVMPIQRKFKKNGVGVIGMKIYGAGKLLDKKDECMRFAQELDYLDAMTIGATTPEEIDENIRLMQKYPPINN
jgi:1-deoxyxylulose-5-phosphate synthase